MSWILDEIVNNKENQEKLKEIRAKYDLKDIGIEYGDYFLHFSHGFSEFQLDKIFRSLEEIRIEKSHGLSRPFISANPYIVDTATPRYRYGGGIIKNEGFLMILDEGASIPSTITMITSDGTLFFNHKYLRDSKARRTLDLIVEQIYGLKRQV